VIARALILVIAIPLAACSDRDNMLQGARLKPFESAIGQTPAAPDGPPLGTIARDEPGPEAMVRPALTRELLARGRERFDIYCAPCHARDGYGDGIIARHGFPPPPSLHDPAITSRDDDHYFSVITNGLGKMPPYGAMVRPHDRWAIVNYIRALQLSQNAPPALVEQARADTSGGAQP
jgi:mono/diheme cytochrome c family protein